MALRSFSTSVSRPQIWENGLKDKLASSFRDKSVLDPSTGRALIPVAKFVATLYEHNVLNKEKWPTARIIEEMHLRGYADSVFTKSSYGAERPPPLSNSEYYKWAAHFRLVSINSS
jgi:hypothetical protein